MIGNARYLLPTLSFSSTFPLHTSHMCKIIYIFIHLGTYISVRHLITTCSGIMLFYLFLCIFYNIDTKDYSWIIQAYSYNINKYHIVTYYENRSKKHIIMTIYRYWWYSFVVVVSCYGDRGFSNVFCRCVCNIKSRFSTVRSFRYL